MSVDPYVITITLDEVRQPSGDQRYYHAKEVLAVSSFYQKLKSKPKARKR